VAIQNLTRYLIMTIGKHIGLDYYALSDDSFDSESPTVNLGTNAFHHYATPPIALWMNVLLHTSRSNLCQRKVVGK
jgi:hypothetical protein